VQQSSSPWCWFHRPRRPRASLSDVYSLPSYSPPASDVYSLPSYSPPAAGSVSPASSTAGRPASEELSVAGGWLRSASRWRRRRRGQSRAVAPAADRRLRALQNIGIAPTWRRWPERHLPGHLLPVLYPAMWRGICNELRSSVTSPAAFSGRVGCAARQALRLCRGVSSDGVVKLHQEMSSNVIKTSVHQDKRHQDKRHQDQRHQDNRHQGKCRQETSSRDVITGVIIRRHLPSHQLPAM